MTVNILMNMILALGMITLMLAFLDKEKREMYIFTSITWLGAAYLVSYALSIPIGIPFTDINFF